jgi:hypothetical protein
MSHLTLVPFAVRQRGRGLVRDPAVHGYSLLDPQWVPKGTTVSDRKRAAMIKKADRVIAVLSRFVARVVRRFRFDKLFPYADEAWANIMEREDNERKIEREARLRVLVTMPEEQLNAHWREQIAAQGERDLEPLVRFMQVIWAKRAQREAAIEENRQVWLELNFNLIGMSTRVIEPVAQAFRVGTTVIQPLSLIAEWTPMSFQNIGVPVILHNPQAAAPVRRVTGYFSALDSDDE